MRWTNAAALVVSASALAGCANSEPAQRMETEAVPVVGSPYTVQVKAVTETVRAPAVAAPYAQSTLSTKLMGTVTAVHVREGDVVRAGQPLVTIDARDLNAKTAQVQAGLAEAEAVRQAALSHARRIRALHAEEAATKAQLEDAETALVRAEAGVRAAGAAGAELEATRGYSVVRAPFNGVITGRLVDPGAFAAPGAPLIHIQDAQRLRVVATAAPAAVRTLRKGAVVQVEIEGIGTSGVVEAVVPAAGNLYRVNVIVGNGAGTHLPGSAATLLLPQGQRAAVSIPAAAVRRTGDLTGVYVRTGTHTTLRWIQLGLRSGQDVEVLAGLREGDQIIVPTTSAGAF